MAEEGELAGGEAGTWRLAHRRNHQCATDAEHDDWGVSTINIGMKGAADGSERPVGELAIDARTAAGTPALNALLQMLGGAHRIRMPRHLPSGWT